MTRALKDVERRKPPERGLKPVEFWVPDLADPAVLAAAEAEAKRMAAADREDDILEWLEAVHKDVWARADRE